VSSAIISPRAVEKSTAAVGNVTGFRNVDAVSVRPADVTEFAVAPAAVDVTPVGAFTLTATLGVLNESP